FATQIENQAREEDPENVERDLCYVQICAFLHGTISLFVTNLEIRPGRTWMTIAKSPSVPCARADRSQPKWRTTEQFRCGRRRYNPSMDLSAHDRARRSTQVTTPH